MSDKKKRILFIEDEEMILDTYSDYLKSQGYEIYTAVDGHRGLDELEKNKGNLDLVILDLMMPGLDGLQLLKLCSEDKEKYSLPPTLVYTNMASERVIKEAFDLGAISYLIKSEMTMESLVKEVEKILN